MMIFSMMTLSITMNKTLHSAKRQSIVILSVSFLSVIYTECHIQTLYVVCRYVECHYAECRGAKGNGEKSNVSGILSMSRVPVCSCQLHSKFQILGKKNFWRKKMQESVRLWLPSKEHESCENLFQFVSQKGFFALFCIHVHWPGGRLYKTYNNVCVIS